MFFTITNSDYNIINGEPQGNMGLIINNGMAFVEDMIWIFGISWWIFDDARWLLNIAIDNGPFVHDLRSIFVMHMIYLVNMVIFQIALLVITGG
jgi:hypothetical protein